MRHPAIAFCLCWVGVGLAWLLPYLVRGVHETHAISTAAGLRINGLVDESRVAEYRDRIGEPDLTVETSLRGIGALDTYLPLLSLILSAVFIATAYCVYPSIGGRRGNA